MVCMCVYFYGGSNLLLCSRCSYVRQRAEVVSIGAGLSGALSPFCFRVSVGFSFVGVNFSLLLFYFLCFRVSVGEKELLWALSRGGMRG